jgi:hypothetical protein
MAEKSAVLNLIAQKREGRRAMEESGMTVEPEGEDMDMRDLLAQLEELDVQLGNDPSQPRLEML